MPGFFPHTSLQTSAYTPLPKPTLDTLLDSIAGDVGAGINGWTLVDDQRANNTDLYYLSFCTAGFDHTYYMNSYSQNVYWTFTQNSPTVANPTSNYVYGDQLYRTLRSIALSGSGNAAAQITIDGANFYGVTAFNINQPHNQAKTFTLDRNFAQTTTNRFDVQAKINGYIVLKCTSAQKTFYVKLTRPASYADGIMVKTYETWDSATHTGTNGGPTEALRVHYHNVGAKGTDTIRYVLWLLPDVFALWMGGDPLVANGQGKLSDFIYVGNLTPYRDGDTDCLVQCCTNNDYSGLAGYPGGTIMNGAAVMLRGTNGLPWVDPSNYAPSISMYAGTQYRLSRYTGGNMYNVWPKGQTYIMNPWRGPFDNYGRFQICEAEVFSAEQCSNSSGNPLGNEAKRGDMKYVKFPMFNPSGFGLVQFGPADDGNTYLVVRADFPIYCTWQCYAVQNNTLAAPGGSNVGGGGVLSGWMCANKAYASNEITDGGGYMSHVPNYFLMPTNL